MPQRTGGSGVTQEGQQTGELTAEADARWSRHSARSAGGNDSDSSSAGEATSVPVPPSAVSSFCFSSSRLHSGNETTDSGGRQDPRGAQEAAPSWGRAPHAPRSRPPRCPPRCPPPMSVTFRVPSGEAARAFPVAVLPREHIRPGRGTQVTGTCRVTARAARHPHPSPNRETQSGSRTGQTSPHREEADPELGPSAAVSCRLSSPLGLAGA